MENEQGMLPGCGSAVGSEAKGESQVKPEIGGGKPRYEVISREQLCWRRGGVERLIGEEHAGRAVWEFVGELGLGGYEEEVWGGEGKAGGPGGVPRGRGGWGIVRGDFLLVRPPPPPLGGRNGGGL